MTVTAKFVGDFSSFTDAVAKAEISLKEMESGAGDVSKALQKMVSSFDGSKIIKDAQLATKAVDGLQGVTKLTEKEQAQLNATLTEALEKYKALGIEAPANMKALAQATSQTSGVMGDLITSVKTTALGFISAQAIISGVQTGFRLLTDFVGSSIESFSSAEASSKKLTVALQQTGQATPSVIGGLNDMAAEFQRTTVYSDDLITEMQALLVQIGDVAPRDMKAALQASTDLASGLGIDLQQATTLVAKAFAGGGDELGRLKAILGDAVGPGHDMADVLAAIEQKFGGQAAGEIDTYAGKVKQLANEWDNFKEIVGQAIVVDPNLERILTLMTNAAHSASGLSGGLVAFTQATLGSSAAGVLAGITEYNRQANEADKATRKLAETLDKELFSTAHADAWKNLIPPSAAATLHDAAKNFKPLTEEQKKAAAAVQQHAQAVQSLADKYSGATSIAEANLAIEAINKNLRDGVGWWEMDATQIKSVNKTLGEALDAYKRFGRTAPEAIRQTFIETTQLEPAIAGLVGEFANIGVKVDVTNAKLNDFTSHLNYIAGIPFGATFGKQLEIPHVKTKVLVDDFGDLARALSDLAQISGTTFGGIVSQLSSVIGAAAAAQKAIALMRKAASPEEKGSLSGLLDMAAGITGIVSAALAAGKAVVALFGLFDRNKGRDLVVDFAETFGGFDALHDKLLTLGDAGEALWIKLTQGVGRNNPQQAQQAIDEVTQALDDQAAKADDAKGASEEQAQATIETATEAAKALEELGGKLDISKDQWKDWGAVVTAQLQALATSIRSLPIPNPVGSLPFSAGSSGLTNQTIVVPVSMDGSVVTEVVAHNVLTH